MLFLHISYLIKSKIETYIFQRTTNDFSKASQTVTNVKSESTDASYNKTGGSVDCSVVADEIQPTVETSAGVYTPLNADKVLPGEKFDVIVRKFHLLHSYIYTSTKYY